MPPEIDLYSAKLHRRINVLVLVLAVVAVAALLLSSARAEIFTWASVSVPRSFHSVLHFLHVERRAADSASGAHKGAAAPNSISSPGSISRTSIQRELGATSKASASTLKAGAPGLAAQSGPRAVNIAAPFGRIGTTGIGLVATSNSTGGKPNEPDAILAQSIWANTGTDYNTPGNWSAGVPFGQ